MPKKKRVPLGSLNSSAQEVFPLTKTAMEHQGRPRVETDTHTALSDRGVPLKQPRKRNRSWDTERSRETFSVAGVHPDLKKWTEDTAARLKSPGIRARDVARCACEFSIHALDAGGLNLQGVMNPLDGARKAVVVTTTPDQKSVFVIEDVKAKLESEPWRKKVTSWRYFPVELQERIKTLARDRDYYLGDVFNVLLEYARSHYGKEFVIKVRR